MMNPREVRRAAGWSQAKTAVRAEVSEPTLRLYEANQAAVSESKRKALDAVYAKLAGSTPPEVLNAV